MFVGLLISVLSGLLSYGLYVDNYLFWAGVSAGVSGTFFISLLLAPLT